MSNSQINLPKTAFSMKANLPTKEPEILEYWNFWASNNNCKITNTSNKYRYYVSHIDNNKFNPIFPNPLKKKLSTYNLINNKHIPQQYIQNTKQIRLQLLGNG